MKRLILLTNGFPYSKSEPYLETEVKYYNRFDIVNIFSLSVRKNDSKRKINRKNIHIYPIYLSWKIIYILNILRAFFDLNFYREIKELYKRKKLNINRIKRLLIFITKAKIEASKISKIIKKQYNKNNEGIIYSYRFEYQAYIALLLKRKFPNFKIIARAHGYDLYEYVNSDNYIPMREKLLKTFDEVICISQYGKKYLENSYSNISKNLNISYLGTLDKGLGKYPVKNNNFNIVSCSNVIKIKRIDKIIEALSMIRNISIEWTHYGDGELLEEIELTAQKKLPQNIKFNFRGSVSNNQVLEEYRNQGYHLFINVSESEGLPVSIMEALSFGIPIIATNVGGTNEVVKNKYNGVLLEKDFSNEDLIQFILFFWNMTEKDYKEYRNHARNFWKNNFNADENYDKFIEHISQMF